MGNRFSATQYFLAGIILLCLSYFGIALFFNVYTATTVDEFWFAEQAYQFKNHLPYRDFAPYKTILGYYILAIPFSWASHDSVKTLIDIRNFIAILNTLCLGVSAYWLRKFFKPAAILLALAPIVFSEFFITYSTQIRVDIFAYWLCLFAVLFIFEERWIISGILLGLGFLTSQKTLWYIIATNFGLLAYYFTSGHSLKLIKKIILFNFTLLATIAIYIIFWSLITNHETILKSVFGEAYIMATLDWYSQFRTLFWNINLTNNPFVFLFWPVTLLSLLILPKNDGELNKRVFIIVYAFVILFSLMPYKQVFPYYMIATMPAFFLLYAGFFSWLISLADPRNKILCVVSNKVIYLLIGIYIASLGYIILNFHLPLAYLLMGIIPFTLANQNHKLSLNLILATLLLTGIICPLMRVAINLPSKNGVYQKAMVNVTDTLLNESGDFVAGIPLIYNKEQPIAGMKHLMAPALAYLNHPTEKLRPVMLASLSETPDITQEKIISALEKSDVKLYVNNYRMRNLPSKVKNYLASQYQHFWGSIYFYSPRIMAGNHLIKLKFSGEYQLDSKAGNIIIDHKKRVPNTTFLLGAGTHYSKSKGSYRLKLKPQNINCFLNPLYQNDQWQMMSN